MRQQLRAGLFGLLTLSPFHGAYGQSTSSVSSSTSDSIVLQSATTESTTTPTPDVATTTTTPPYTTAPSSSIPTVTPTPVPAGNTTYSATVSADLELIYQRRIPLIVQTLVVANATRFDGWVSAFQNGQFTGVDYTAGCPARRANWPAQGHWNQINPLAAAYVNAYPPSAGFPSDQFVANATVASVLDQSLNWWFQNDFTEPACLDQGGLTNNTCPCGTPGLWNQNWFSNVILVPRIAGYGCLLLNQQITPAQRQRCIAIAERGYGIIDRFVYGLGYITGANTLDLGNIGVSAGLLRYFGGLEGADTIVTDAFRRIHADLVIHPEDKADGIRPDGSFGQHLGILYNGNYGKDYTNLVLMLELQAAGTQWAANKTSQDAFASHMDGSQWMIYKNTITGVLHWDFSVVGRFLSFPVKDNQATGSIKMNLTQVQELGELWGSSTIPKVATNLQKNVTSANAGDLVGNRMFYHNDYMVHRSSNYVTTVKMLSPRTSNTECVNSQNPFGFHLGQGVVFTYQNGNEYEDIQASWDWNLIPGITTDYAATKLECNFTQWGGNETFVGGASTKKLGVAAMKYLNPYTASLRYRKAWFFFGGGVQHVTVAGIQSTSGAEIYSVLDQKRKNGTVYVDGTAINATSGVSNFTARNLWHDGIGYSFGDNTTAAQLSVSTGPRTGNWSLVGTSTEPPYTVDLFGAWVKHDSAAPQPVAYSVYPGETTYDSFVKKAAKRPIKTIKNDVDVAAAVDAKDKVVMIVFWEAGKSVDIPTEYIWPKKGGSKKPSEILRISSDQAITLILDMDRWEATVADPTHLLQSATITATFVSGSSPHKRFGSDLSKALHVTFPPAPYTGKSVKIDLKSQLIGRYMGAHIL